MGQECSCQCGDGKSEMDYQGVSYNFIYKIAASLISLGSQSDCLTLELILKR